MENPSDPADPSQTHPRDSALLMEYRTKIAQLEHSLTQQSAFMARMIHELRTPLNSIMGFWNWSMMEN